MTLEQLKMLLSLMAPVIDAAVKATPTPIDNIAWSIIRKLMLSEAVAQQVYGEMVAKGMAAPTE